MNTLAIKIFIVLLAAFIFYGLSSGHERTLNKGLLKKTLWLALWGVAGVTTSSLLSFP